MWRLNNTLLPKKQVIEEIKKTKFLETNEMTAHISKLRAYHKNNVKMQDHSD